MPIGPNGAVQLQDGGNLFGDATFVKTDDGTDTLVVFGSSTRPAMLRLIGSNGNAAFLTPHPASLNPVFILPPDAGTPSFYLMTDGAGGLSWSNAAALFDAAGSAAAAQAASDPVGSAAAAQAASDPVGSAAAAQAASDPVGSAAAVSAAITPALPVNLGGIDGTFDISTSLGGTVTLVKGVITAWTPAP